MDKKKLFKEAMAMPPSERFQFVDMLLKSLDQPDEEIDSLWRKESESRIDAYDAGHISSITVEEAFKKYQK